MFYVTKGYTITLCMPAESLLRQIDIDGTAKNGVKNFNQ